MRRSTSTKQPQVPSTWSERTRRTRPKASMVFHDWQVAKVGSTDELRSGKGGLLVAASVEDAESAWGAALDTVAVYPEAKVAVVCSVPWDGSVRHLVTLSDGGHQDVWSRFQNLALPRCIAKQSTPSSRRHRCLFHVHAAYVHAATWDTAMKAAQSV
ncbi:hypothetical protein DIPPA_18729 [Diplonema papillatum]|nr:hypothetical protein DIPPA_18729 [Diplonema papillatum]